MAKRKKPNSHAREREFRKRDRARRRAEKAALKRERRQARPDTPAEPPVVAAPGKPPDEEKRTEKQDG